MDITRIYEYLLSEYLFANGAISQEQRKTIDHQAAATFMRTLNPEYLAPTIATARTPYIELEARQRREEKQLAIECSDVSDTDGTAYSIPLHLWDRAAEWKKEHVSPMSLLDIARLLDDKGEVQKLPPKEPTELEKLRAENDVLSRRIAALENMQLWYARLDDQKRQIREFQTLIDSYAKDHL